MAVIEVRLLGPIELVVDGRPVSLSTDALIDRLWHGRPPATAGSVLRTYVSQLRKALPDERLGRVANGSVLHLHADELDAKRLENAVTLAPSPGVPSAQAAAILHEALSLWRGPPLLELGDDGRSVAETARLESCRVTTLEAWADAAARRRRSRRTSVCVARCSRTWAWTRRPICSGRRTSGSGTQQCSCDNPRRVPACAHRFEGRS